MLDFLATRQCIAIFDAAARTPRGGNERGEVVTRQ